MKFITEDELRDIYRKEPFTTYEMEPGTRLTPGARQFLADRGINMLDDEPFINNYVVTVSEDYQSPPAPAGQEAKAEASFEDPEEKAVFLELKTIESEFLLEAQKLLSKDVILAQTLAKAGKKAGSIFENYRLHEEECPFLHECHGMNKGNFCKELGDCFEITEFHMQLPTAEEVLSLNRLRSRLRQVEPLIEKAYEGKQSKKDKRDHMMKSLNKLVNCMSQAICAAVGGKECQRK